MEPLLQVEAVQEFLGNALIGHRIDYYHSVGSTMDLARQAAEEGAVEGTVIVAEEQTAGRGRFGRKWVTAPGRNLSFSVVLYPDKWAVSRLGIAAAVAVARVIRHMYGLSPGHQMAQRRTHQWQEGLRYPCRVGSPKRTGAIRRAGSWHQRQLGPVG